MRALSEGRLGNVLQVGTQPGHEDLAFWRESQGLPSQPAVVIASASLDFPSTMTHQLIGGTGFHAMLPGPLLGAEGDLRMRSLYYEPDTPKGSGQFFAQFDSNI